MNDRVAGVVYLSRTPNNIVKHLYGERGKLALAGLAILAITLFIGYVFVRLISRPMRELLDRTRRIAGGDTDHPPAQPSRHAQGSGLAERFPRPWQRTKIARTRSAPLQPMSRTN